MPSFVIDEKCDGCKGQDKTACMYICPNDLMVLDMEKMKAYNRDPHVLGMSVLCQDLSPAGNGRAWLFGLHPSGSQLCAAQGF
jgi:adenylylsulfate reductase, subunit B